MKIIVCLDDRNGMLFNKRRQSADKALCQRVLDVTEGSRLWMNSYSANLFPEAANRVCVDEDFLETCNDTDWCFVENADLTPYTDKIKRVILYRWNRSYPRDLCFPMDRFTERWSMVSSHEFAGNSHEKITEEVYAL